MSDNKKTIFIVDDDEFILDMYAIKFREEGFEVEVAKSGEEALRRVREGFYSQITLLDIIMPGLDGFEFLRIMKKENLLRDSLIVVLTNLGQKEDVQRALDLGAHDYIVKAHFTPLEVVKKVNSLLEHRS